MNLFETVSYTAEDIVRTGLYQQEAERVSMKQIYQNESDYLQSLQMKAEVKSLDAFVIPRAAQLSQRSNQFNLRTVRYSEHDLQSIAASQEHHAFVVSLRDKFGDYGIISLVVLQKQKEILFIENWMMSCRVLKRGVEQAVLNRIVSIAKQAACRTVRGEYLPTPKNGLVKDHYKTMGFLPDTDFWELPIDAFEERKTFIYFVPQPTTENVPAWPMERDIISELTPVFQDVFGDANLRIHRHTTADDIEGWDSISHIELIVATEQKFGIRFKSFDLEKLQTVGDLADLVEAKLLAW